jgi:hypothetical protein
MVIHSAEVVKVVLKEGTIIAPSSRMAMIIHAWLAVILALTASS